MKKAIANDCIKVLYEISERNPLLIAEYVTEFLDVLMSRNNRIVWGAMTALAAITEYKADVAGQKKWPSTPKGCLLVSIQRTKKGFSRCC